jgi:hypothetical protein
VTKPFVGDSQIRYCDVLLREVVQTFKTSAQSRLYFSRDVNEFLSVLSTFVIHLGEIRSGIVSFGEIGSGKAILFL